MRITKFPAILVFKEKHGDDYFIVNSIGNIVVAFNKKFNERKDDWYFDEELPEGPEDIYRFMLGRQDYEYEGFEIEYPSSLT